MLEPKTADAFSKVSLGILDSGSNRIDMPAATGYHSIPSRIPAATGYHTISSGIRAATGYHNIPSARDPTSASLESLYGS